MLVAPAIQGGGSIDVLIMGLKDSDRTVREQSIIELGKLKAGIRKAIPALLQVIRNDDEDLACSAYGAIWFSGLDKFDATESFLTRFETRPLSGGKATEMTIGMATTSIGYGARTRRVAPALGDILRQSKSEKISQSVFLALRRMDVRARGAIPGLREKLADPKTAPLAAEILFRLEPGDTSLHTQVVNYHIITLSNKNTDAFWQPAISDLGLLGPVAQKAVPVLTEIANSGRLAWNRKAAEVALKRINPGGKTDIDVLVALIGGADKDHRAIAMRELQRHGSAGSAAIPILVNKLTDPELKFLAASTLLYVTPIGTPIKKDVGLCLVERLEKEPNAAFDMYADVVRGLGRIGPDARDAIPILKNIVKSDRSATMRAEAGLALLRIERGNKADLQVLLKAANDSDRDVRSCALEELGKTKEAVQPLRRIRINVDRGTQQEIDQTLKELESK
jgi:HEAT repeat protein